MKKLREVVALALVVAVIGCNPPEEEAVVDVQPKFEGKPDPRFVGTWTTEDSKSTYTFEEDGKYGLKAKITTPGGVMNTDSSGSWAINGDRFLIKDPAGNVVAYAFDFKEPKLTLGLTGSMKTMTVLVRAQKD